jgi:hypothetical protein
MKELLLEAADYVEEYRPRCEVADKLRAAAARMEWVPVAEQLPEEYPCDVWVTHPNYRAPVRLSFRGTHSAEVLRIEGCDYWQYAIIPEPPKEGKS